MREIKFRAWDKEREKMFYFGDPIYDSEYDWLAFRQPNRDTMFYEGVDTLMQYTGLKDKNGKEIYEGDIVRLYTGEVCGVVFPVGGGFVVDWYDKNKKAGFRKPLYNEIYFDGPSVSFTPDGAIEGEDYYTERKAEIIGNIYENPEMLGERR